MLNTSHGWGISARAHMRFCNEGTAWPIGFNFGVCIGGHELGAQHKSWVEYLCTCARAYLASVSQERFD